MSPSEEQLRAALAEGQGPGISADRIIARAREVRHQRRVRYGSALAIAAAVAGIGVGGGLLVGGSGNSADKSAHGSAAAPVAAGQGAASADTSVGAGGKVAGSATAGLACPAGLPLLGSPAHTTAGPLFPAPVSALTLCLYPPGGGAFSANERPSRMVLAGSAATSLVSSIESAPTAQSNAPCPLYRTAAAKTLLIIGQRSDGATVAFVETQVDQNPCNIAITNGTAVRYNWSPPRSLSAFLGQPPLEQGSPVRS